MERAETVGVGKGPCVLQGTVSYSGNGGNARVHTVWEEMFSLQCVPWPY
jgi:hypothetical protein